MFNPEMPPAWSVSAWLNCDAEPSLGLLKGKVVVMTAFQMLCPGCVSQALPQAQRLYDRFSRNEVAVVGLHTVFEHKEAMTVAALKAFVHEYGWSFPIGIDAPAEAEALPKTMAAYKMQGTPTLLIFDREGRLRRHYFGRPDDTVLGAEIMAFALETDAAASEERLARTVMMPGTHDHHQHGHDDEHGDGHGHHHHHHEDGCGCGHNHGGCAHR